MTSDPVNVYDKCLTFVDEGSIAAVIPVENPEGTAEGVFACGHDFTGAPYFKRSCFHPAARRRAVAAFAMVRFTRKIALENGYKPVP